MAFVKKDWKDRIAEFINRRRLTYEDGRTELVEVARDEGNISQEGDAFNAENMNDLEERVAEEFKKVVVKTDIIDNLESTETEKPLSANQGAELNKSVKLISEKIGNFNGELNVGIDYTPNVAFIDILKSQWGTVEGKGVSFVRINNGQQAIALVYSAFPKYATVILFGYMFAKPEYHYMIDGTWYAGSFS